MRFLIVIGLGLVSLSADVLAQANEVRGLDFRTYLSIQRGMTEGQLLSIAGNPDLLADQGFVASDSNATLAVKTYTYLPTPADPYTTTITLTGGTVTEIQRDRTVSPSADVPAQTSGIRGLDFRSYLSIQRGMTEGHLLGIAGNPDLLADQGFVVSDPNTQLAIKTYTYLPTSADPYTTTITLVAGKVAKIERERKF